MPTQANKNILLATDHQRSVVNSLDANQLQPITYSPYGHRLREKGLPGFNGETQDPFTGRYHLGKGYRQYSPILMRFASPDSWSPFGKGGLNTYGYCGGDPKNNVDPSGHFLKAALNLLAFNSDAIFEQSVKINSKIRTYPYPDTSLFQNSAALDGNFGRTITTAIYSRARNGNLVVIKEFKNNAFKFQTTTPIRLSGNAVTETRTAERLTAISKNTRSAKNILYLQDINEALKNSPKGLERNQVDDVKHFLTRIRETSTKYQFDDLSNQTGLYEKKGELDFH